jgi:hypothetical protein
MKLIPDGMRQNLLGLMLDSSPEWLYISNRDTARLRAKYGAASIAKNPLWGKHLQHVWWEAVKAGDYIKIRQQEDYDGDITLAGYLNEKAMDRAEDLMARSENECVLKHYRLMIEGSSNCDIETVDIWLQYAIFGELKYE